MEILEANSILPFILKSRFIGSGETAMCFKMNNQVLKLFNEKHFKLDSNFQNRIKKISTIANDTYIAPEKLLFINGKMVGYFCPYIDDVTLRKISDNTKLSELFKSYEKLVIDTKDVSNNNFRLSDLHDENILFNGSYAIIDLDMCFFNADKEMNFNLNMRRVFKSIIWRIYKTKVNELPLFEDREFEYYLNHIDIKNMNEIDGLIRMIANYSKCSDPTIKEIRHKIKVKNVYNEYFNA